MNYLDKLKHLNQPTDTGPTIQAGDRIEWQRAGTVQHGLVDFLHEDVDGTMWVFCVQGATWAAVNMKFVTGSGHE